MFTKKVFSWVALASGACGTFLIGKATADSAESDKSSNKKKLLKDQRIVVVGGGSAGVGVSAQLLKAGAQHITIIEPSSVHYYQPLWTLVGAGIKPVANSVKPMAEVIPKDALWLQLPAARIVPQENIVELSSGARVPYDYLILCPGLQTDWNAIPGLESALKDSDSGVVSVYGYDYADKTSRAIAAFKGGRAIFTVPQTPIKCPGAVQKIMWLFEEKLNDANDSYKSLRHGTSIELWSPLTTLFGVEKYANLLEQEREQRNVAVRFRQQLIGVDGTRRVAKFKHTTTGEVSEQPYDLLHVSPPMSGPDFLKEPSGGTGLANAQGFVIVNPATLQSTNYPNIFALGDVTNTPNSKTLAAVTSQAPVVVHNVVNHIAGKPLDGIYEGYASCPLIVARNRCILAEFGYGGKLMETFNAETGSFPFTMLGQDNSMARYVFAQLKKNAFPWLYWHAYLSGRWYGPHGFFQPDVTAAAAGKKGTDSNKNVK